MLSSIILSMAMSVSPATVTDTNSLDIETIGDTRGTRRLNSSQGITLEVVGDTRGTRRLSASQDKTSEVVGDTRGTRRL